jgi:hypothetical protein
VTEGQVAIHSTLDPGGNPSERVLFLAYLSSALETGFASPIDETVRRAVVLTIRARRPLINSRPSVQLLTATLAAVAAAELLKRPFFARTDQGPRLESGEKRHGRLPGAGAAS